MPAAALRFLVDPVADDLRHWPVTTSSPAAIASARHTLEAMADWDRDGEPLVALMDRVATFG
jgi:hypothetical protein